MNDIAFAAPFSPLAFVALAIFAALATVLHFASIAIATARSIAPRHRMAARMPNAVSIIRPVCGLEHALEETLRSGLRLSHPDCETLFCVDSPGDSAIPLIRRLIAEHPSAQARLLIGRHPIGSNPKLNNMVKGWRAARYDWVMMADSNVLLPPDAIGQLAERWDEGTGLVCSPPTGFAPNGLIAELECAFLNSHQARWQLVADAIGFGFAQGKVMFWRRENLDRAGGIEALARECAEDAAATKIVRAAGLGVRLVRLPFAQPLGRRAFADIWKRQVRWARLRRLSFPAIYAPELACGGLFPLAAIFALAGAAEASLVPPAMLAIAWYMAELGLIRRAGWPLSPWTPAVLMLRDILLPVVWIAGVAGAAFVWRGNAMDARRPDAAPSAEPL